MNIMANGKDTAIPMILRMIPNHAGTFRTLFNAIVVIIIAHKSMAR
jgi:hypothetical protein